MAILSTLLYFVVLLVIIFGIMFLGNKFIFSKVRINKYIPLGIAIATLILQMFMPVILGKNIFWVSFLLTIITLTFFIWFMNIQTTGGPKKKEKKIAGTIWTGSGELWDWIISYRLKLVPGVGFVDISARWGGFWIYSHNGFSITCFQSYVFCLDVETLLYFYGLILVGEIHYILFFHIPNTVLRQRRGKPCQRLPGPPDG